MRMSELGGAEHVVDMAEGVVVGVNEEDGELGLVGSVAGDAINLADADNAIGEKDLLDDLAVGGTGIFGTQGNLGIGLLNAGASQEVVDIE